MYRFIFAALLLAICSPSHAVYNANLRGVLASVHTYDDRDSIYFTLINQPAHPACDREFFVIDASVSAERRRMMHARLLLAHATGELVNIGYDGTGNCSEGRIRVHRVG